MSEKRYSDRTPTHSPGRLFGDRLDLACTILDVSPTGARVEVPPGLFLPKQMTIRSREWGGDRQAWVVWRNKTQIGLRF